MNTEPKPHSTRSPIRRTLRRALLCLAAALIVPLDAAPVLIATGDGTGNTEAPAADPGFGNVGIVNSLSGVYVGNGWVLTANHVGEHPIELKIGMEM